MLRKTHRARIALLAAAVFTVSLAHAADDIEKLAPAKLPQVKPPAKVAFDQQPLRIRVLVLEFNPLIPAELIPAKAGATSQPASPASGGAPAGAAGAPQGIREVCGYNDPLPLAAGYMQDFCDASGGLVQYEIAEWLVVRRFQKKTDGFTYTPATYMACRAKLEKWHDPDGIDYPAMIEEFKITPRVESGAIDEVWMMGIPYFGYFESCMAGKDAFYINGDAFDQVPCKRRFAIMGFNVERGVAEMDHDVSHRTESTMARIYGGWKAEELTSNWARFAANLKQSGSAAVGTCHWPPNAEHDYDYGNKRMVESTADDWLHYPELTGRKRTFNCEEWAKPFKNRKGDPDYQRNYMVWWFTHLPRAKGVNADGRLNNWWEYVYNFNAYDEHGQPLTDVKPAADAQAEKAGYRRPA